MAAIPDAGGAWGAPRAVTLRALLRVVVFGGLVIAGWLLGSGTALAHDDPGYENLAQYTGLFELVKTLPPDGGLGGPLGAPPTVESTVRSLMRAAPVQRLAGRPPAHVPVVTPVLARVSEHVAAPVLGPVVRSAPHAPATTSGAAVDKPTPVPLTAVPLAGPVIGAGPGSAPASAAVQPTMGDVSSTTPVSATPRPVASQFAGPLALGGDPAAPVPTSPLGTTTAACPVGSSGGGTTHSAHFVTLGDRWAMADVAPRHRLHTSFCGIPRSAANHPTTTPD